jgi:hypothetical protein
MGQFENMLAQGYEELAKGIGRGAYGEPLNDPMMDTPSMNPDFDPDYGTDLLSDDPEKRLRIEQEAHELVFGDREAAYGHPSSDFTAMGRITAAILSRWLESEGYELWKSSITGPRPTHHGEPLRLPDIAPEIVALIMTAVKLSRQSANPKRDNLVDLIGYTLCADRIIEGE